jgi:8-hydroxy-5-deazaflavin:NADPH oxidoreductase
MNIGILGTGMVGHAIGTKLVQLGHDVKMGSRTANSEKADAFVRINEGRGTTGTFAEAAEFGEIIFNCTSGAASLHALKMAGKENLHGKILVDVANPLDFSKGRPPILIPEYCNTTSLGEEIQKAYPDTRVVKTFNTMNCNLMVKPDLVPGSHDIFICGDDAVAKAKIKDEILHAIGWHSPIDLGGITAARSMEMMLPVWINLMGLYQSPNFNFKIVKV